MAPEDHQHASHTTKRTDSVTDDIPVTGNPIFDSMTKIFLFLGRQTEQLLGWKPPPSATDERKPPTDMTDKEIREALFRAAADLNDTIGRIHQASFPATDDPRWRYNVPTTVDMHVRAMFTHASDAFGVAIMALQNHASAAALAAIRHLAESLTRVRWLLEPSDTKQRRERAYAITQEAITWQFKMSRHVKEAATAADPPDLARKIAARADATQARLTELMKQDGLQAVKVPGRPKLFADYMPGIGYVLFALLSSVGSHPAAAQSALFYSEPSTGNAVYDLQELNITRAYWIARAISLYTDLCKAAAPILGWKEWDKIITTAGTKHQHLSDEADRRYQQRLQASLQGVPRP